MFGSKSDDALYFNLRPLLPKFNLCLNILVVDGITPVVAEVVPLITVGAFT